MSPPRTLTYKVEIDTGTARQQAAAMRAAFEKEMRQISLGRLDTSALDTAQRSALALSDELNQVEREAREAQSQLDRIRMPAAGPAGRGGGVAGFDLAGLARTAAAGIGIGVGGFTAKMIAEQTVELSQLGTQAIRTEKSFQILSGGEQQAAANLEAIIRASGGAADELKAIEIANQALALKLADTPEEFAKVTRAGRAVALVSPIIHDVQSAISELGIAAANLSWRRLDQLGLTITEVKTGMAELQRQNTSLSDSEAFFQASLGALETKYGAILDSSEAAATGLEILTARMRDLRVEAAKLVQQGTDPFFNRLALFAGSDDTGAALKELERKLREAQDSLAYNIKNQTPALAGSGGFLFQPEALRTDTQAMEEMRAKTEAALRSVINIVKEAQAAYNEGKYGAEEYLSAVSSIAVEIANQSEPTQAQIAALSALSMAYADMQRFGAPVADTLNATALAADTSTTAQVTLAQAMVNGQISADNYIAILGVMTGEMYDVADAANIAAAAIAGMGAMRASVEANLKTFGTANPYDTIYNLNSGPSTATGVPSLGIAASDPYQTRMELLRKETEAAQLGLKRQYEAQQEAEKAAKRAASEQERAAKRAGKELESSAKKAADELRGALQNVPGLFGRSQVTEDQMTKAKAGLPQNFADDFLRRAEDEIKNGVDWAEVDVADIARRVGLDPGLPAEIILGELQSQWESGAFFADKANLELINQEAVQAALDLQEKAKQGQQNIYELFGVAIDDAVSAVGAGISGGGGSVAAGGAAALSGQLIPMSADGMPTLAGYTIAPTLDTTALQEQLAAFKFEVELSASTGSNLVVALGQQIGENSQAFMVQGQAVGAIVGAGVVTGAQNGPDLGMGLLTAIGTDIAAQSTYFLAQGQTVGAIVKGGVASAFNAAGGADSNGQAQTDIAMGLLRALNSQFGASQNMFYAAGQTPAFSVLDGYKATFGATGEGAPLVTPMVTAINTQIRMKSQDLINQGTTIAQYVQHGVTTGFNGEAFKTALIAVGESLYASIRIGMLNAANGGDLVESLGAKILADISAEVEQP